jgi:SAM-dependent methyltransferase
MAKSTETTPCCCNFEAQHEQHTHPAMRALEKEVLGCDFGGTSWTTRSQADGIPATLKLDSDSHLLEIGAGTGWPGIYLAGETGCNVTLLDVPVNSLKYAWQRAADENLGNRCDAVAASGAALPFANGTFGAIGHSDVLCCLPEKLEMLKECRRVARTGTRMLFYVIAPARGLSGADLDEACSVGPPFVDTPDDYSSLLAESGWSLIEKTDLTAEYLFALRRFVESLEAGSTTLEKALGLAEFNRQLQHRREQVSAIERGLLEREMYLVETLCSG